MFEAGEKLYKHFYSNLDKFKNNNIITDPEFFPSEYIKEGSYFLGLKQILAVLRRVLKSGRAGSDEEAEIKNLMSEVQAAKNSLSKKLIPLVYEYGFLTDKVELDKKAPDDSQE